MLIILVGLPSVGKSTFSKKLSKELYFNGIDNIVLGTDIIRECFPVWDSKYEKYIVDTTYQLIDNALKEFYVIVDDTNYYNSKRRDLINIANKNNKNYVIIYLTAPINVLVERNRDRGEKVPKDLIIDMSNKFDEPGKKYSWDKPDIVINTEEDIDFSRIINTIMEKDKKGKKSKKSDNRPIKEKSKDITYKRENPTSTNKILLDRIDKITREIIGEYIKEGIIPKDKNNIKVFLELRKKYLKSLNLKDIYMDKNFKEGEYLNKIEKEFISFLNNKLKNLEDNYGKK
ncbi:AAA family ATPase [Methanothermococcus sp. SCGC AD-155-M21]|nr:AAA family ATPase [Methanothermococcus sp. SCGC AD-155-M21]